MTKKSRDAYEEKRRPVKKSSGSSHKSSSAKHDYDYDYDDDIERRPKKKKSSGKKSNKKAQAKKKRRRIILFILEIFVLVIMVMVLYIVLKGEKTGKVELKEEEIIINDTVNECKLVSVYRDTYLNLSNDTYNKCNAAYAKGGPEMAISMLNMNLDMNITDFITVGFAGLTDTIDALGGVYIEVDSSEISHLNNYQLCIAEDLKRSYTPVTDTGYQLLDGLQATGYCRIRYTAGDDFKRAERQREVLSAVADQAKKASPAALGQIAGNVFEEVYTSLDLTEIVELLADVANYNITETGGFPYEDYRKTGTIGTKGSCVVPVDLEQNVKWLHQFLFNDYEYEPSGMVKECSEKIKADTGSYQLH